MKNKELADIFYDISALLEMQDIPFKPQAYQRAAVTIEGLKEDIESLYNRGGLKELEALPAIGKSIALQIEEYLKTGKLLGYKKLKKSFPFDIQEITKVEGMGVKKAKRLWEELKIKNIKDLEKAAKDHKIAPIEGFGEKTERNILEGIKFLKRSKGRFLLSEIIPRIREIEKKLKGLKEVEKIALAGSIRRMKETIGDADLLVVSKNPKKVMDFFTSQPEVAKVWAKGMTKSSVRVKEGFDIDLRIVRENQFGSALQYFTGSKDHNIVLRKRAIEKGLKLSEYGLFKGDRVVSSKNEEDIYKALKMEIIVPELREDQGEIDASIKGNLPKIIEYNDLKGDLHIHSNWDGGTDSIKDIALAAKTMGYLYVGISDHTKFLKIENGLDERQLEKRNKEIDKLNKSLRGFKILKGAETNILKDGRLDIKDSSLKKLDFVIAGIHSNFKMTKAEMTERIIKAIRNPNVDIISHPTGRILKRRDEYEIDFDKILKAAKEYNVALEINSCPERLDLNDKKIRRTKEAGVKMIVNSDAHIINQLNHIEFGIAQARRGWAEREDIINTWSLDKLLKFFNK